MIIQGKRHRGTGALDKVDERSLATCAYCPKLCTHVCPVSTATRRETHSPWGKQTTLFEIRRGMIPLSTEYVEPVFACTECHACQATCDHGVDVASSLRRGRALVFESGLLPEPLRALLRDQPGREAEARRRAAALSGTIGPATGARVVLMPGCSAVLEDPEMVRAGIEIVRRMAGESTAVTQEACCGLPYLQAGDEAGFVEAARRLSEASSGFGTMVVLDPACAWTLRKLYPAHGVEMQAEVVTLVEFVLPLLHRFVRRSNPQGPVFYHDPCHLGRGLGLHDPPREILLRLVAGGARDLFRSRESEPCCGGGGAIPRSMPAAAQAALQRLAGMFVQEGARTVVTACSTCRAVLSQSEGFEVVDLTTLLAQAL